MKTTKSREWYYWAYVLTTAAAWIFCVVPTLIAGLIKLPATVTKEAETTLTGSFTLMLIIAAYPLLKGILKMFKSPSAWLIIWIVTGLTFLLWQIPRETIGAMFVVLLVAAIGNSVGAILFWLGQQFAEKWRYFGSIEANDKGGV